MQPIIDHIQITVKNLEKAEAFYDLFLPLIGFDLSKKGKGRVEAHDFDVIEYVHPKLILGINSPRKEFKDVEVHRRRPGSLHHLAFRADSPEEIDQLYRKVIETGADIVDPPKYYPQHGEKYYALFFKDPCGIKLEIMHEEQNA
jgi:catechol 2,3-dioxygenase-like lactoylglutathione lyase family enzyme